MKRVIIIAGLILLGWLVFQAVENRPEPALGWRDRDTAALPPTGLAASAEPIAPAPQPVIVPDPIMPAATATASVVRVPILVYHEVAPYFVGQTKEQRVYDVEPAVFARQMALLADHGFQVISLGELVNHLLDGTPLPEKPVVITFDDGWRGQYDVAWPILKKHGFTATFFIYIGPIGRRDKYMTWAQVRELDAGGMTIGSHTLTHQYLTRLDDKSLKREVEVGKTRLEKEIGHPVDLLAYPFGLFDQRVIDEAKTAGFRAARTIVVGDVNTKDDVMKLKTVYVGDNLKRFMADLGIK